MKAIGINIRGEKVEINILNTSLQCVRRDLVELWIPKGVRYIYCSCNNLTHLELPSSCRTLHCEKNMIKQLVLPKSCLNIKCDKKVVIDEASLSRSNLRIKMGDTLGWDDIL